MVGVDGLGNPIIYLTYFNGGSEIWIASSSTNAAPIAGSYNGTGFYPFGPPIADSHGIWLPGSYNSQGGFQGSGLALYVLRSGIYWMSGIGGQLAGGCN